MNNTVKRFVLDTNTLVSAFLWPESFPGRVLDKALLEGLILASDQSLKELESVLKRTKFDAYVSLKERLELFKRFELVTLHIEIEMPIAACRDPKDNKFLELAVNGNANMVITGDKDLLSLHPFEGIPIIKAREFIEVY